MTFQTFYVVWIATDADDALILSSNPYITPGITADTQDLAVGKTVPVVFDIQFYTFVVRIYDTNS